MGELCLYADLAGDQGCALRATADSPPPTAVQMKELLAAISAEHAANERLRTALTNAVRLCDDTRVSTLEVLGQIESILRAALSPSTDDTATCPPHDFDLLRQCHRCGLGMVRPSTDDTEADDGD